MNKRPKQPSRLGNARAHPTVPQWAEESIDTAEAFACLEGKLNHAKVPSGSRSLALSDGERVPAGRVREGAAECSATLSAPPDASIPALNPGYETSTDTIARRRAALAGRRLGAKLKAIF